MLLCFASPATSFFATSSTPFLSGRSMSTSAFSSAATMPSSEGGHRAGRQFARLGGLRMGGANVPRVPYKAPGEQGYQVGFFYFSSPMERICPGSAQ